MPLFLPPKPAPRQKYVYELMDELRQKIGEINKMGYEVTIPHYDVKRGQHRLKVFNNGVYLERKPGTVIQNSH